MKEETQRHLARPIFVLGDSRTGTKSLHNYFQVQGLRSTHYFVEQAGQTMPLHLNLQENEQKFMAYVAAAGLDAYSDYPTRTFFRRLHQDYPEAAFILSVRSSTERWLQSMRGFFGKFNQAIDGEELSAAYEGVNTAIRVLFADGSRHFLELCIDDDSSENSAKLADFLGFSQDFSLSKDNATDAINNGVLSERYRFYSYQGKNTLLALERVAAPGKAIISEYGWAFLVNDSNDFLKVQFGHLEWSAADRAKASEVIRARVVGLQARGTLYRKFVIPEKSVTYREYLPRVLDELPLAKARPAEMLQEDLPETVFYLDRFLIDARSYGLLYFRGDTHPNWMGAWFIYAHIVQSLASQGLVNDAELLTLSDLVPQIAAYDGDLWTQLNPELKSEFQKRWAFTSGRYGLDMAIKLTIPEDKRRARRVDAPEDYKAWFGGRETFVYERADGVGKRAVVFRDSTADFCHDLIAQHFSRTVFIWHQGQVFDEVVDRERPDVVLHVMAERFVTRYPQFLPFGLIGQSSSEI